MGGETARARHSNRRPLSLSHPPPAVLPGFARSLSYSRPIIERRRAYSHRARTHRPAFERRGGDTDGGAANSREGIAPTGGGESGQPGSLAAGASRLKRR